MNDPGSGDARQGIGSVETAARILFALEQAGGPLSLNQLASRAQETPSKVHRYLVSLGRVGLTTQSQSSGKYDLGSASRRLGGEALRRTNEVAVVTEYSIELSERTGHAVNISVWTDSGPVIVRWDYGAHPLSLSARVGASLPLLQSAAGQVFLAFLPGPMTEKALKAAIDISPVLTMGDTKHLIEHVRGVGVGVSDGGVVSDVYSIAAPVFSASDALPLALTIAVHRDTSDADTRAAAQDAVIVAARAASLELGSTGASD